MLSFRRFVGILESRRIVGFDEIPAAFVCGVGKIDGKYLFPLGIYRRGDFGRDFEEFLWGIADFRAEFPASCRDVAAEFVSVFRIPDARNRDFSAHVIESEIVHSFDDARNSLGKIFEFLEDVDHSQGKESFFRFRIRELGSGDFSNSFATVAFRGFKNERLSF